MNPVFRVTIDVLREARARKSIFGPLVAITLVLLGLGAFLRLDIVDGAIAGSKLFGSVLFPDIVQADRALRPIFMAVAWSAFELGSVVLAVACSDFAPNLLAPGRIEHLLSLPISRWHLLIGTYLGVVAIAFVCAAYGAAGVTVLFGLKTGLWTWRLLAGALLAMAGFCAIYAAMLCAAVYVRSAALGAAVGLSVLVLGALSTHREDVLDFIDPGVAHSVFSVAIRPFPRLTALANAGARLAGEQPIDLGLTARLALGALVFSAALLTVAIWRFDRRDF